ATNAILQQERRERDTEGRIVATLNDYAEVYELVVDLVSRSVGASVSPEVRQTVKAVRKLSNNYPGGVPQHAIVKLLNLDKGAVSLRVKNAIEGGYLVNDEWRPKQPHKLKLGEPLPDETEVLPTVELLNSCGGSVVNGATVREE